MSVLSSGNGRSQCDGGWVWQFRQHQAKQEVRREMRRELTGQTCKVCSVSHTSGAAPLRTLWMCF